MAENISKEDVKQKLIDSYVKGLKQIYSKIEHTKQQLRGLELLKNVRNFYPIIITFDDTYYLNEQYIRSKINNELQEAACCFIIRFYKNSFATRSGKTN